MRLHHSDYIIVNCVRTIVYLTLALPLALPLTLPLAIAIVQLTVM